MDCLGNNGGEQNAYGGKDALPAALELPDIIYHARVAVLAPEQVDNLLLTAYHFIESWLANLVEPLLFVH